MIGSIPGPRKSQHHGLRLPGFQGFVYGTGDILPVSSASSLLSGPEAVAALEVPEVRDRLQYLITEGREEIYYRVYTSKEVYSNHQNE